MGAPAQDRIRLPLWMRWAGATTIGLAVGMTLSTTPVGTATRPLGPVLAGMLNVLIFGAVNGIALGLSQFAVMPRGLATFRAWLLATMLGNAVGLAAAALIGEALGSLIDPTNNSALGEGGVALIAGAIMGLVIGFAQWRVMRPRLDRSHRWITATTIGMTLGSLTAAIILGLFELPVISEAPASLVGAVMGIWAGVLQGIVLASERKG